MMSQLFALPLRALIIAAALPTPSALGATLPGPSALPGAGIIGSAADRNGFTLEARIPTHSIHRSAANPAGR
jgi:hypothetical protein